jgi:hypothetical protein
MKHCVLDQIAANKIDSLFAGLLAIRGAKITVIPIAAQHYRLVVGIVPWFPFAMVV